MHRRARPRVVRIAGPGNSTGLEQASGIIDPTICTGNKVRFIFACVIVLNVVFVVVVIIHRYRRPVMAPVHHRLRPVVRSRAPPLFVRLLIQLRLEDPIVQLVPFLSNIGT